MEFQSIEVTLVLVRPVIASEVSGETSDEKNDVSKLEAKKNRKKKHVGYFRWNHFYVGRF